jgi:hypothetical protein
VIVLSGVLTVVALVLLVVAGLQEDVTYVYGSLAAGALGAALVAVAIYQRRGELTLDDEDEPRSEDEGELVGVRPATGEQADGTGPATAALPAAPDGTSGPAAGGYGLALPAWRRGRTRPPPGGTPRSRTRWTTMR